MPGFPFAPSRLDLAVEANSLLRGEANVEIKGVSEEVYHQAGCLIHIITILDEQGAEIMGRPRGRYITLDIPHCESEDTIADIAAAAAGQLRSLLPLPLKSGPLLVVGLGNDNATPDALGPTVAESTFATRHLFQNGQAPAGISPVCAISPGVLGNSGIETAEIIRGICQYLKPAALIAVDSLAAASVTRVGTTIQISDTGIRPGSGVGNERRCIDKELLGCPVIAIGVPTVVDSAAIIAETASTLNDYWQTQKMPAPQADAAACGYAEEKLLSRFQGRLMVTPKDIDTLIEQDGRIIAAAIAMAVHPAANKGNYRNFID